MRLSLDFMPIDKIKNAPMDKRIELIISKVKEDKIIVFNTLFKPEEEAVLIKKTMENVNKRFPGIEICSLSNNDLIKNASLLTKLRSFMVKLLTGSNQGITVIGPAKIIKKLKREPDSISLLTK